jgi:hypothetical protein
MPAQAEEFHCFTLVEQEDRSDRQLQSRALDHYAPAQTVWLDAHEIRVLALERITLHKEQT